MDDEEAFVDGIMEQLQDKPRLHTAMWLKVVRTMSSMAATFLIMLYVWQQMDVADEHTSPHPHSIEHGASGLLAQEPETMDKAAARETIDKYLADRVKRQEKRKQSITNYYARL